MSFQIKLCGTIIVLCLLLTILSQKKLSFLLITTIISTLSMIGYFTTVLMIPVMCKYMIRRRIYGLDINKKGTEGGEKEIPESLGLVSATVFVLISFGSLLIFKVVLSEAHLTEKFAALACIVFSVLLGFVDDVIDIPWRYKLVIPLFGILPVLIAYDGVTYILLPDIARSYLGTAIDLGVLYYIYMAMLGIFCTNSINIYAGINGLEVGQSLIIACSIMVFNSIEIFLNKDNESGLQHHMFSILLLLPYIAVAFALFKYNAYPSQVFVGDTFCYFSGAVFAVTGILGHFSKTLLLMFIPQILNFLYSIPQLFGFIPCPRHRLPKFNIETKKLQAIPTNLNLVNLALMILGPQTEEELCNKLLVLQCISSAVGLFIRYILSRIFWS